MRWADEGGPMTVARQPALDGVRALALVLVLFFHAGFTWMPAGYMGVSVFFTLSGYLITSLLLDEFESSASDRARRVLLAPLETAAAGRPALPRGHRHAPVRRSVPRGATPAGRPDGGDAAGLQLDRTVTGGELRRAVHRVGRRAVAGQALLVAGDRGAVLPAVAVGPVAARPSSSPPGRLGAPVGRRAHRGLRRGRARHRVGLRQGRRLLGDAGPLRRDPRRRDPRLPDAFVMGVVATGALGVVGHRPRRRVPRGDRRVVGGAAVRRRACVHRLARHLRVGVRRPDRGVAGTRAAAQCAVVAATRAARTRELRRIPLPLAGLRAVVLRAAGRCRARRRLPSPSR